MLQCRQCQTLFQPHRREQFLCSPACAGLWKTSQSQRMGSCLECGKEIHITRTGPNMMRKFCGRSCSARFNNRAKPKRRTAPKPQNNSRFQFRGHNVNHCACGKVKTAYAKKCKECDQPTIESWLAGRWNGSNRSGYISRTVRLYLMSNHPICVKCGWGEIHPILQRPPLEVNHIDGDATNNLPSNLEVICPNCHALTPNFRNLNRVSKRTYRSKRAS